MTFSTNESKHVHRDAFDEAIFPLLFTVDRDELRRNTRAVSDFVALLALAVIIKMLNSPKISLKDFE